MRILDKQAGRLNLSALGMDPKTEQRIADLFRKPHGIILVTGPTGSGKTTTLYAGLEHLNDNTQNIMTVEDPIEYYIDGIGQTQVNTKVEMTFARGLRAILRQDPDVVMVGEIRDLETAQIAVQASLTGHLVLSTLHTNTAVGARHAPARHGHRTLPAVVEPHRRHRAAPGAHAQPRHQAVPSKPANTNAACSGLGAQRTFADAVPAQRHRAAASAAAPASTSW